MAGAANEADELLAAARAGSQEALGRVLEICRRYLLFVAQCNLNPQLQAKGGASDLVQETFLEAHRDFGQFHGTTEDELLAWLRRMLLNNAGNFVRRYQGTDKRAVGREVTLSGQGSSEGLQSLAAAGSSPSGLAMAHEQTQALQRALARLPDEYRRVLTWRFQDEKSFEEIGRLLDRSADAARKLWSRAMQRLRQEWESAP